MVAETQIYVFVLSVCILVQNYENVTENDFHMTAANENVTENENENGTLIITVEFKIFRKIFTSVIIRTGSKKGVQKWDI